MEENIDANSNISENGETCPVNLVTRIKYEAEEPNVFSKGFVTANESHSIMDHSMELISCFRRRRRGRSRYVPYGFVTDSTSQTQQHRTNGLETAKKPSDCFYSVPATKSFSCPNCQLHFGNRDSLAMHMMESVRLDGCQKQNNGAGKKQPPLATPPRSGAGNAASLTQQPGPVQPPPGSSGGGGGGSFFCKICRDSFSNLDSLAMHMFIHIHQQESVSPRQPTVSSQQPQQPPPPVPLPDTVWSNQINSSLYLKSLLSTTSSFIEEAAKTGASTSLEPERTYVDPETSTLRMGSKDKLRPEGGGLERNCHSAPIYEGNICQEVPQKTATVVTEHDSASGASGGSSQQQPQSQQQQHLLESELALLSRLHRCVYCKLLFEDPTVFCVHMGLHNVNNPWQCNMCGKKCSDLYDFTVHALHF